MTVELKRTLAAVWTDRDVARLYRHRPPYPPHAFAILERLIVDPRVVLDAGAGTGALARRMTSFAIRVDAVDPSAAMIEEACGLPGGASDRLRWIVAPAETAPLSPPYGLITTGQSLHWMDHAVVMPRFADALAPGARLVSLDIEWEYAPAWREALLRVIERFSPAPRPGATDLFGELERRGLFERHGYQRTTEIAIERSIDELILMLQSTSSLSRVVQGERADAFADEVRALFRRLGLERARFSAAANVVWGRPLRP